MIHQRNVLRIYYIVAALAAFALSAVVGSVFVSLIIVAIVSLPIIYLIRKILPAPEWYANETEGSQMTSLNLTATKIANDKTD